MVDANQRWDVDEAIQYMKNVRAGDGLDNCRVQLVIIPRSWLISSCIG